MALDYHQLEITKISSTARDAVCVTFGVPEGLREVFAHTAGQHLTLNHDISGEKLRRFYSICSLCDQNDLRIGVRQIEEGRFSGFLNQQAKVGNKIEVLAPRGRFVRNDDCEGKHILAFAAGSGITPIYAILQQHLSSNSNATATLIFGNRSTQSIMLREDLNDLKDTFMDRFQISHMLSREQQELEQFNGRIDEESIKGMIKTGVIVPGNAAQIFICGPSAMIDITKDTMVGAGVDAKKISIEQFTAVDAKPDAPSKTIAENISEGAKVTFILDGTQKEFVINNPKDTVLSSAIEHGHDMPSSCRGGMCATCRCKLIKGEVEMASNFALEPWELEAGYVLACQSRPKTKTIKLDFDAQ